MGIFSAKPEKDAQNRKRVIVTCGELDQPYLIGSCLYDQMRHSEDSRTDLYFSKELKQLHLATPNKDKQIQGFEKFPNIKVFHSDERCFNRKFTQDHKDYKQLQKPHRQYLAAACIIVQDADGRVLLTRRADTLSFFTRAWVLPGGHVDPNETLLEAVLRELHEECGLNLNGEFNGQKLSFELNSIFESSTPGRSALPSSSHVIVFYRVKLPVKSSELQLRFDYREVGAGTWVEAEDVKLLLAGDKTAYEGRSLPSAEYLNRRWVTSEIPMAQLAPYWPNEHNSGMSGATRIILANILI